jgi:molybdopterin synthase sulfur carrier subunit
VARVLLFGRLADAAGWRERTIEAVSLSALRAALGDLVEGPGVQAAVDKAIVRGDMALTAASEVAFLPPMSGG